jgi:hypothetical protein
MVVLGVTKITRRVITSDTLMVTSQPSRYRAADLIGIRI